MHLSAYAQGLKGYCRAPRPGSFPASGLPVSRSVRESPSIGNTRFRRGTLVRHSRFGPGRVDDIDDVGGDYRATINFQGADRRARMPSFAKLGTVDGELRKIASLLQDRFPGTAER